MHSLVDVTTAPGQLRQAAKDVAGVVGGLQQAGHDRRLEHPDCGSAGLDRYLCPLQPRRAALPELATPCRVLDPHTAQVGEQSSTDLAGTATASVHRTRSSALAVCRPVRQVERIGTCATQVPHVLAVLHVEARLVEQESLVVGHAVGHHPHPLEPHPSGHPGPHGLLTLLVVGQLDGARLYFHAAAGLCAVFDRAGADRLRGAVEQIRSR